MIKKLFPLLLLASPCFAEGPLYRHLDRTENLEFQNVYQDIRAVRVSSSTLPGGSTQYIQNSTSPQNATFVINAASVAILDVGNIVRNGTIVSSITAAGEVTLPLQPSFFIYANANQLNVSGDNSQYTFPANPVVTEVFDQGNDVTSSTFTAPVTGRYLFCATNYMFGMTSVSNTFIAMRIVTSNRTYYYQPIANIPSSVTDYGQSFCTNADMDSGDTAYATIAVGGSSKIADIPGSNTAFETNFNGRLLE